MVHGDDFVVVGPKQHVMDARKTLENKYKLKVDSLGTAPGCKEEVRILNKVLRYTNRGLELEADPRHAEIVIRQMGLEKATPSRVPGAKGATPGTGSLPRGTRQALPDFLEEEEEDGGERRRLGIVRQRGH